MDDSVNIKALTLFPISDYSFPRLHDSAPGSSTVVLLTAKS
jgi:hypothetical protein